MPGESKDRTPAGLKANVQIPHNTDTKFAQRSSRICFDHRAGQGGEVPRVHTEPESHLNNCCVKSAELPDIPTVQQAKKQTKRLGPVKRNGKALMKSRM